MFDEKYVEVSACLKFYYHWLGMAIEAVGSARRQGKLEGISAVREAPDAGVREFDKRVRELGIILGAEHEFVRYAQAQPDYQAVMEKGGALMADILAREKARVQSEQVSQAGNWLARAPAQGCLLAS